jgi:hypothetical protein
VPGRVGEVGKGLFEPDVVNVQTELLFDARLDECRCCVARESFCVVVVSTPAAGVSDEFGLVFGHDGFEHFVMTRLERLDEIGIIDCH